MRCALFVLLVGCIPLQENGNTVSGQVLYGGQALAGAVVRLVARTDGATRTAFCSDAGAYSFSAVAPGDYSLLVGTDKWATDSGQSLPVTVAQGEDLALPTLALTPAGVVRGTLDARAAPDAPIEGTLIRLEGTAYEARADAEGLFTFGRVAAGNYRVTALGSGTQAPAQAVEVRAQVETVVRMTLLPLQPSESAANAPPVVSPLEVTALPSIDTVRFDASLLVAGQLMRGARVRIYCPAQDTDTLSYTWQVSGGVVDQEAPDTIVWTASAGAASIRCTVSDTQGAFASATVALDVVDYRFAGAAWGDDIVYAQSDDGVPDFDIVVGATRFPLPGQQVYPHAYRDTVVYASDRNATALNPTDVYALGPSGEVRLTSTDGSEVYDIGPAGIAVGSSAIRVGGSVVYTSASRCDRVVVGQQTIVVHDDRWRMVSIPLLTSVSAPSGWNNDVAIAFDGSDYVAAVPALGKVYRVTEAFTLTELGDLPELTGTVTASVATKAGAYAYAAFDDGGLYGGISGVTVPAPNAPVVVFGVSGDQVLYGDSRELRVVP